MDGFDSEIMKQVNLRVKIVNLLTTWRIWYKDSQKTLLYTAVKRTEDLCLILID